MSTTPGAGQRRRTRIRATLLAAGALAFIVPMAFVETGSAAQLKVTAAPIQTWSLAVQPADFPTMPELDVEEPETAEVDGLSDIHQPPAGTQQPGSDQGPPAGKPNDAPLPELPELLELPELPELPAEGTREPADPPIQPTAVHDEEPGTA